MYPLGAVWHVSAAGRPRMCAAESAAPDAGHGAGSVHVQADPEVAGRREGGLHAIPLQLTAAATLLESHHSFSLQCWLAAW